MIAKQRVQVRRQAALHSFASRLIVERNTIVSAGGDAIFYSSVFVESFEHPERRDRQDDDENRGDKIDEIPMLFVFGRLGGRR